MRAPGLSAWFRVKPVASVGAMALGFLVSPGSAAAHDGAAYPSHGHTHSHASKDDCAPCTRHAWREYQAAQAAARRLQHLDCAGLAAYTECQRWHANMRILGYYLSPTVAPIATPGATAPAPVPSIEPADAPPPPETAAPPTQPPAASGSRPN